MTGYCVRIQRDGQWQAVDIDELTDEELAELERLKPLDGWRWTRALVRWIRANVHAETGGDHDAL